MSTFWNFNNAMARLFSLFTIGVISAPVIATKPPSSNSKVGHIRATSSAAAFTSLPRSKFPALKDI